MNSHDLCLSFVILFLYHRSVELTCGPPLAKTVLECWKCLVEGWLECLLHLLCAFWGDFGFFPVYPSLLLKPFLIVLFQLLSYSLLHLLVFVLLVFESFQGSGFVLAKLLNKLVFSFLENHMALLINLIILNLRTKLPFWNPKTNFSAWACSTSYKDCSWWRISEDQIRLSSQIPHWLFEFGEFSQARYHNMWRL